MRWKISKGHRALSHLQSSQLCYPFRSSKPTILGTVDVKVRDLIMWKRLPFSPTAYSLKSPDSTGMVVWIRRASRSADLPHNLLASYVDAVNYHVKMQLQGRFGVVELLSYLIFKIPT